MIDVISDSSVWLLLRLGLATAAVLHFLLKDFWPSIVWKQKHTGLLRNMVLKRAGRSVCCWCRFATWSIYILYFFIFSYTTGILTPIPLIPISIPISILYYTQSEKACDMTSAIQKLFVWKFSLKKQIVSSFNLDMSSIGEIIDRE